MLRSIRSAALVATVLAALGGTAEAQIPSPYAVRVISLPGAALSYAQGINNNGVAVGAVDSGGALREEFLRAAIYANGGVSGAGVLVGYIGTYDYAINDAGQSVGWAIADLGLFPGPTLTHAVLFVHDSAQDLGALVRGGNSTAYAINVWGVAAGSSDTAAPNGPGHAALFTFANHTVNDLGLPPGDQASVAYAINGYGQVVGSSIDTGGVEHAVRFVPGPPTRLGALPGDTYSQARGLNDLGQAVGYSASLRTPSHAVMFAGGQVIDLGLYPGGTHSAAVAINNLGQAVGTGDTGDGGFDHALLFQNGQVVDLGKLPGGQGSAANGINDRGDIVGSADNADGLECAVEWTLAHQAIGPLKPLAAE